MSSANTLKSIILFGASGQARSVIEVIEAQGEYRILGLIDSYKNPGERFGNYSILGGESDIPELAGKNGCVSFFVAVGDNFHRQKITARIVQGVAGAVFVTVIHPTAYISCSAQLGLGSVVMPGAIVRAGVCVEDGCIVNTKASLDHDCHLNDYSSIGPGATLSGSVNVGERTAVGTGVMIREKTSIGDDVVIGTGAAVVDDIPEKVMAFGNPCQIKKCRQLGEPYLR